MRITRRQLKKLIRENLIVESVASKVKQIQQVIDPSKTFTQHDGVWGDLTDDAWDEWFDDHADVLAKKAGLPVDTLNKHSKNAANVAGLYFNDASKKINLDGVLEMVLAVSDSQPPVKDEKAPKNLPPIADPETDYDPKNIPNSWKGKLGKDKARGSNFHILKDGKNNYRGAIDERKMSVNADFFRELRDVYGIESLVALNHDHNPGTVRAATEAFGKGNVLYVPTGKGAVRVGGKSIETLDVDASEWNDIKDMLNKGNTLIHCTHGADRTGATVGRYYVEELGWDVETALKDAYLYKGGGKPHFYRSMRRFIEKGLEGKSAGSGKDETVY